MQARTPHEHAISGYELFALRAANPSSARMFPSAASVGAELCVPIMFCSLLGSKQQMKAFHMFSCFDTQQLGNAVMMARAAHESAPFGHQVILLECYNV